MIISASYKTDIPTFYGEWFRQRLEAGFCRAVNPYGQQRYTIPLTPDTVDGFVFWTKNIRPFFPHLADVNRRGWPFVVQYTINRYPRQLETSVIDARRSVENMRELSNTFGKKVAVWRYDTILMSALTPAAFHLENFAELAQALAGTTDEVVISFAQIYRKTRRNMDQAAQEHTFTWNDPSAEEKRHLTEQLANIARKHGMQLTICSQPELLVTGVGESRCIDAERLSAVADKPLKARRQTGNRPQCQCAAARDIGEYDTCPHGCVYCYAVQNHSKARQRFKEHDPANEFLVPPTLTKAEIEALERLQENAIRLEAATDASQADALEEGHGANSNEQEPSNGDDTSPQQLSLFTPES